MTKENFLKKNLIVNDQYNFFLFNRMRIVLLFPQNKFQTGKNSLCTWKMEVFKTDNAYLFQHSFCLIH